MGDMERLLHQIRGMYLKNGNPRCLISLQLTIICREDRRFLLLADLKQRKTTSEANSKVLDSTFQKTSLSLN